MNTIPTEIQPPALAPLPPLEVANVVDPPLPAVTKSSKNSTVAEPADAGATPASPPLPSGARANVASSGLSIITILVFAMLFAAHQ